MKELLNLTNWRTISAKLRRILPDGEGGLVVKRKAPGGDELDYIKVWTAMDILDDIVPEWKSEITGTEVHGDQFMIRVRLSIWNPEKGEWLSRENIGWENVGVKTYGDTGSNAFAMAFCRAAASFGVSRHLYQAPDYEPHRMATESQLTLMQAMFEDGRIPEEHGEGILKLADRGKLTYASAKKAIAFYENEAKKKGAAKKKGGSKKTKPTASKPEKEAA